MVKVNWTIQSKSDLVTIAEYISQDSKAYARVQIKRIRSRANQICDHPQSGRVVPEIGDPTIRELILGSYRIIYLIVSANRVDILTIHHSAKQLRI